MFISIIIDGKPLVQNEEVEKITVDNLFNLVYGLDNSKINWERIEIKISNFELNLPEINEKSVDQPWF